MPRPIRYIELSERRTMVKGSANRAKKSLEQFGEDKTKLNKPRFVPRARDIGLKFGWFPKERTFHLFSIIPKSENLGTWLGLNPKDKIHFFEAASGEWAKAIAKNVAYVKATDISNKAVKSLNKKKGKIATVSQIPAQIDRHTINEFDWSITFEQSPLFSEGLEDIARNSLLNRKGLMYLHLPLRGGDYTYITYRERLERFATIYGVTCTVSGVKISENKWITFGKQYIPRIILETTPEAQKKAELDIMVETAIYQRPEGSPVSKVIDALSRKLGLTVKDLEESLARIRKTNILRYMHSNPFGPT